MAWTTPADPPGAGNPLPDAWLETYVKDNMLALANIQVIEDVYDTPGSHTWTKPPGLVCALVRQVGGGGGGGGADNGPNAAQGGQAGGYCERWFAAADLGASEDLEVGAGGAGGADTGSSGSPGGTTTFGSPAKLTAGGGSGGDGENANPGSTNTTLPVGGGSGSGAASGGTINKTGELGGFGFTWRIDTNSVRVSGRGGSGPFGTGGRELTGTSNGIAASGAGAGGGGAACQNTSGRTGGAGSPGMIVVTMWVLQ